MVMSKKMLETYKEMPVTSIDKQVLFLCKNNKYHGIVSAEVVYQQFKTAVVLNDAESKSVFRAVLLNWIDSDDIELLEFYSSKNFSPAYATEV